MNDIEGSVAWAASSSQHKRGPVPLTILGGGPAGLATGYFAAKSGIPFHIFEAGERAGGNCVTFRHGEFLFDSGAHRFHTRDPLATFHLRQLMNSELVEVDAPSHILHRDRLIDFPLTPINLARELSTRGIAEATGSFLRARMGTSAMPPANFRDFAVRTYGRFLAECFLLNYSEKLWGLPCEQLSPRIAGARMKGLRLKTLVLEAVQGARAKTRHLDGRFLYPTRGYGRIVERLAEACGPDNITTRARVDKVLHDGRRIHAIEVCGRQEPVRELVATVPLGTLVRALSPAPAPEIAGLSEKLRFRSMVLVALFIRRPSIGASASVYFPDRHYPFTRVFEPRNRSRHSAPAGCTSLVVEFPCWKNDDIWNADDASLAELCSAHLTRLGWFKPAEVLASTTRRLNNAYPVLDLEIEGQVGRILAYLSRWTNLRLIGRNSLFAYAHMHDMLRSGHELVSLFLPGPLATDAQEPVLAGQTENAA